jgi:hypothetical protein
VKNEYLLDILVFVTIFLVVPLLVVWRLSRRPVGGDIPLRLTFRGAVAGVAGGSIGATLSSLVFRPQAYDAIGYIYASFLLTPVVGIVFALIIGAVQRNRPPGLSLPARTGVGALIGIVTAFVWAGAAGVNLLDPKGAAAKGLACMLIGTGVVAGILSGPLKEEEA